MFIGHYGAGLAAKGIDSKPSLGTLFFASQFVDLLWPIFLLLGIEKVKIDPGNTAFTPLNFVYYPFSHSFAGVLFWALLFGVIYFLLKKNLKTSVILGVLVLSHWILDLITHRPDLAIFPWMEYKAGFGLWNSVLLTILLEGFIFAAGAYIYIKYTNAKSRKGVVLLWSLLILLSVIYFMNIFGPPPPSEDPIAIIGLSQWLFVGWGYWIDKNRSIITKKEEELIN